MSIRASKIIGSPAIARLASDQSPTELSAMKQTLVTITLLLSIPAIAVAQTPTRERRSAANRSTSADAPVVRDRVVGSRSNHVESQGPRTESKTSTDAGSGQQAQENSDATWGNASVIVRPTDNVRIAAARTQTASVSSQPTSRTQNVTKKLVQPTSLSTEVPLRAASYSRPVTSARAVAVTATYGVGIGDVLDVRLANMPTRESTLFTVLKNGTLEYPLLSGPVSVAGLSTDEIASLLSSEIKVIQSARVTVSVRDYASHGVTVTGLVDSPGRKVLRREAMPLYAVLAEALVRPEASTATISRNGKEGDALPLGNDQAMATLVQPGDVIKIGGAQATAKQFLYVGGDVAAPGEKFFRSGMTLTQALLSAGGTSRTGKTTIKVSRRNSNGFLSTNEYSLRSIEEGKSPDPVIQAGDRIEVMRIL